MSPGRHAARDSASPIESEAYLALLMSQEQNVSQAHHVTDDSTAQGSVPEQHRAPQGHGIAETGPRVRRLSAYQFSFTATAGGTGEAAGTWQLQLVLDAGAREETLTLEADDARALQAALEDADGVVFDEQRRSLMFGMTTT